MGTWQIKPFENDSAKDWSYELKDIIILALDSDSPERIWAASEVICRIYEIFDFPIRLMLARKAFICCSILKKDSGYVNGFREPEKYIKELEKTISKLESIYTAK